jgi:hypothetical protein
MTLLLGKIQQCRKLVVGQNFQPIDPAVLKIFFSFIETIAL